MKFLLVDDHTLFRHGLVLLLQKNSPDNEFLEAESCETAFTLVAMHRDIDVILLDLTLPGINGMEGLEHFQASCPAAPIVLLSANEEPRLAIEAIRRGARGFIPKSSSPEVVLAALQVVLAGGVFVPHLALAPRSEESPSDGSSLTPRQAEVLKLIVQNRSNKEIAHELGMRVNTVRVHVAAILKALGAANRNEAASTALRLGIVPQVQQGTRHRSGADLS